MPVIGGHRGTLYKTSVFGAHRGGTTQNICLWCSQRGHYTKHLSLVFTEGTLYKTSVFGVHRGGTTQKDKDGREMMNEIMEDIF